MPMHESSCIEDPSFSLSLFLCCQLVSLSFECLPWEMHAHCGSSLSLVHIIVILMFRACVVRLFWPLRLLHSLHLLSLHLSYLLALLAALHLLLPWRTSAGEVGPQSLKQNWDLREAHEKGLNEIVELKKFQSSTFDTIARRRSVEDRDTILELTKLIVCEEEWESNTSSRSEMPVWTVSQ